MLSGCFGYNIVKIKTEVQQESVPILYCPKPDIPERPSLPIQHMTPEQLALDGEIAKHYKATVKVLQSHVIVLEKELDSYNITNDAYEKLKSEIINKIKNGQFDPIVSRTE